MSTKTPIMAVAFISGWLGSCASQVAQPSLPSKSENPKTADVVVTPEQYDQGVRLLVGQTLAIKPPIDNSEWDVDYQPDILLELIPRDKMEKPGAEGWLFRARAPGETDVMFSGRTQAGSGPTAARFAVKVRVQD